MSNSGLGNLILKPWDLSCHWQHLEGPIKGMWCEWAFQEENLGRACGGGESLPRGSGRRDVVGAKGICVGERACAGPGKMCGERGKRLKRSLMLGYGAWVHTWDSEFVLLGAKSCWDLVAGEAQAIGRYLWNGQ